MTTIIQADRDAAADCYLALTGEPNSPRDYAEAQAHRDGHYDAHASVQAFARHRLAAEARAREDIEAKLRNVISHATGGSLDDTTLPLNEIAVRISAFRTRLWNDALAKGREEGAKAMQAKAASIANGFPRTVPTIDIEDLGRNPPGVRIAVAIAALDPAQIAGGGE